MKILFEKLRANIKKHSATWAAVAVFTGFLCVNLFITYHIIKSFDDPSDEHGDVIVIIGEDGKEVTIPNPNRVITPEPEVFGRSGAAPAIPSFITSVTAESVYGRVIGTDTVFILTTESDIEAEELKKKLSLEASVPVSFSLSKLGERTFALSAAELLPEDSIIRLNLHDTDGEVERRWAFQTAPVFKITSTLPGDGAENVWQLDTGIEINFTAAVNPSDMEDYFSMTEYGSDEEISGRFERFRNTVVFVPAASLKMGTLYTVTVSAGLPSADGIILEEEHVFSFTTGDNRSRLFLETGGKIAETFIPGDPTVLQIFCSAELGDLLYDVKLYEFPNSGMYREYFELYIENTPRPQRDPWGDWWYGGGSTQRNSFTFATAELELREIYSSQEMLLRADESSSGWWSPSYFMLPENLSEGWYLAEAKTEFNDTEYRVHKLIQINPVSVYASSLPNEALFFINNAVSGLAAENADVTINTDGKSFSARADASGIAHVDIAAESRGNGILTVTHGTSTFIDLFNCRPHRERTPEENYFMLLYTDRELYRTTDEIYVWGLVIPREAGIPLPQNIHLQAGTETENAPLPVTLSPDGTFTAKINIQNHIDTWWYLISLMTGDEIMIQKRIQVRDFVKPSYVFDIDVPFYAWMPQHDPVTVSLTASFFEGTPAPNLEFTYWDREQKTIYTDDNGFASRDFLVEDTEYSRWDNRNTWRPQRISVGFELAGIENERQSKRGEFWGLFRDVMLEHEYTHANNTLTVTTSMVDPSNFSPREQRDTTSYFGFNYRGGWFHHQRFYSWGDNSWLDFAEILRGEAADVAVTGTLTRYWIEAVSLGTHYDFIQKRNVERFRYESRDEIVGTYTINTRNGTGTFTNLPTNIEGSWYRMELEWLDTRGQRVTETVHLHNRERFVSWGTDTTINNYTLMPGSHTFTEDQIISFQLENNAVPVNNIPRNARVFLAVSGSEFITTEVHASPAFSRTMTDAYIPNVEISGAYFDGRHIFPIATAQYRFDSGEREILIDITTDRDRYSPSDRAVITVTARDLEGRVVPDARVSLSTVDEAAFALVDQHINTLRMLYAFIHTPRVESYFSYIQHSLFGQSPGEWGGGDGGDTLVRRDFRDNAAFLTGTTDENGTVRFTIDLPDNLTSWRLTVQVVGENADGRMGAGNLKQPLIVTLPLFLTVNSLPEYTLGDDVTVSARINGQNISGNPLITATITGGNLTAPLTATAYSDEALRFGKLPLGMYTLLITASDGRNSDAIELPLEVVESLLETPITRTFSLNEETLNITPLRYPVSLTFYDPRAQQLQPQVLGYLFKSWGDRTDFRVARAFAQLELEHIDEAYFRELLTDISSGEGLIRLLPYGEGELELTALICVAAPDIVNRGAVTRRFYNIISSKDLRGWLDSRAVYSAEEITYAYLGLAALNEPVLAEIQALLADPAGLSDEDMLRLCTALALLGDEQTALEYYIELTERYFSERADGTIRIGTNRYTALALMTAGSMSLDEAEGLARYLMTVELYDRTFVLELMTFLRFYIPPVEQEAVFTYNIHGRTETVALQRSRWGQTFNFGKEQLENADFTVISGEVGVRAFYTGTLNELIEQTEEPVFDVTKTYSLAEGSEWVPGALVRVSITVNGTTGTWLSMNDIIPSGARFAGRDDENRFNTGRWVDRSLQRVNASLCLCNLCGNTRTITYMIRLVNSGEFITESVAVRDNAGNWGMSERGVIVIE